MALREFYIASLFCVFSKRFAFYELVIAGRPKLKILRNRMHAGSIINVH